MVVSGYAKMVGSRSGKGKNGKDWCAVVLDALDDPLERLQYFVPDELADKVSDIGSGDVCVEMRIYPGKDGTFGSRLLDINPVTLQKGGEK